VTGKVIVIDKPDAGQAAVYISQKGIARKDPRYYVATVGNAVLGGGYSARLNEEVRIKRGLSYGASSSIAARRAVGPMTASAQTKNPSAGQVTSLMLGELRRLATEAVPDAERTARVASLAGDYARALETGGGLAGQVGTLAVNDRPLGELNEYLPRIQAVNSLEIQQFFAQALPTKNADVIIVGDAKQFLPDLKKRTALPILVIPVARLDLDAPVAR
jgi:zinc protease